jgi:hypothetical protein
MDDNQVDEFKEAFRVFDTDHGGTIDAEEYSNLMAMLGMVRMLLVVVTLVDGWFGGGGGVVVVVLLSWYCYGSGGGDGGDRAD